MKKQTIGSTLQQHPNTTKFSTLSPYLSEI